MLELAIFIIPGFVWYYSIYRSHNFQKLDASQWILIPLLVTTSAILISFGKLLFFIGDTTCAQLPVCFYHYESFPLAKVENFEIGMGDFLAAICIAVLIPAVAKFVDRPHLNWFFNPFGQFRLESAIVKTVETLMLEVKPAMLVLNDKRTYIGMVQAIDNQSGDSSSLSIIPWMSGSWETGKLKITTNYLEKKDDGSLGNADFAAECPISFLLMRSVSIRGFSLTVFLDYYKNGGVEVCDPKLKNYFDEMIHAQKQQETLAVMYPDASGEDVQNEKDEV